MSKERHTLKKLGSDHPVFSGGFGITGISQARIAEIKAETRRLRAEKEADLASRNPSPEPGSPLISND